MRTFPQIFLKASSASSHAALTSSVRGLKVRQFAHMRETSARSSAAPASATAATATYVSLFIAPAAHASGSSMPWEAPLQSILDSVEGPVAKIVAVIIIIVTGLTLAFGDTGGGFRRLIQIVFGISIAFAASSFFLSFFSFGGGALI